MRCLALLKVELSSGELTQQRLETLSLLRFIQPTKVDFITPQLRACTVNYLQRQIYTRQPAIRSVKNVVLREEIFERTFQTLRVIEWTINLNRTIHTVRRI